LKRFQSHPHYTAPSPYACPTVIKLKYKSRPQDIFFLKVMVDQFSSNRYIPINNHQGGGVDISFFQKKNPGHERNFCEIKPKVKDNDSTQSS
jgi:hypothetical protein